MTNAELRLPAPELARELEQKLDPRTRRILEARRRSASARRRGWLVRRALVTADLVGLSAVFLIALWLFGGDGGAPTDQHSPWVELLIFALTLPAWVVVAKLYGLYERDEERTDHSTADDFGGVFHLVTVGTWLFFAGCWVTGLAAPELDRLVAFWMLAIGLVFLGRATARGYCRRQIAYLQNTIIVGAGDVGQLLARKYLAHPEYGINLVGFVDAHPKMLGPGLDHLAVLGTVSDLQNLIRAFDIERVLVAFSNESHTETLAMLRELRKLDVQVDIVPRLFEEVGPSLSVHTVEGFPILSLTRTHLSRSSALLKRSVDVTLSSVALLVLAPLFLAIAIAIKLDSRGPILYRHDRIGRGGRKIDVLKFRTMFIEYCRGARYAGSAADRAFEELLGDSARREEFERSYKLTSDPRVTRVGAFLRRTSLDELPQLVNVLRGELSLVGPRPLVAEEVERYYGGEAETLLSVKPGITGYWQVNGRSELAYVDRVRLDLAYIANWSLELDFRIIVKTFHVIFGRRGAF